MKNLSKTFIVIIFLCNNHSFAQLNTVRFDVSLELDYFTVKNVKDLDGTEDLFTEYTPISCYKQIALTKTNATPIAFWSRSANTAGGLSSYRSGTQDVKDQNLPLFTNLTLDELKNLELYMGGDLMDHEGAYAARQFSCVECTDETPVNLGYVLVRMPCRIVKFIDMSTTQTSINALVNNDTWQTLKFGADNYFELNFYESGNQNDGWVKYMWRVWVKPHSQLTFK